MRSGMVLRIGVGVCALLLVSACASAPLRPVTSQGLTQARTLDWRATNPQPTDGATTYAMAEIDTSTTKLLFAYERARPDYPSVGGDILSGIPRTPQIAMEPVRPASPGSERLRDQAPTSSPGPVPRRRR